MMPTLTYLQAIGAAQREAMMEDDRVILMGEDIRTNMYGTSADFVQLFGAHRVINTPISEAGFAGMGVGAAMTGLRPIIDMAYATFTYLAFDQLINQAAKNRYMFGGQSNIPVVYRATMFYNLSTAAHHSDRPYPMLMNVPGLKIVTPATPYDAKGLLRTAVRTDDPVVIFEDATLWTRKQELPEGEFLIPLGEARIVRAGTDVTVVAIAGSVYHAQAAAEALAEEGISIELIDPRTLVPLDSQAIVTSVAKTGRLVVVDPANRTCGAASEIVAIVAEEAFDALRSPVRRVTTPNIPIPFSPTMEKPLYPNKDRIIAAVREVVGNAKAGERSSQSAV
jgi:acetoin:2,6-dichlorophenolindophenol oxidoreductase subunit beta